MRKFGIGALLLLAAVLGACSPVQTLPRVVIATPSAPVSPLATAFVSPAPTPAGGQPTPELPATPPPTSVPGAATVTGFLFEGSKPAAGLIVALAPVLPDAKGTRALASYNQVTASRAVTDASGHFVITNVRPATYALILDRVIESYMLNKPNSGGDMVFTPQAGQVLDLGKLVYDKLPGSQGTP